MNNKKKQIRRDFIMFAVVSILIVTFSFAEEISGTEIDKMGIPELIKLLEHPD